MTTPTIAISNFARGRLDAALPFSHFDGSEDELIERVRAGFDKAEQGYREGVLLVPVDPKGFHSPVCELAEGDRLVGEYKARREGEQPRLSIGVEGGTKSPAAACSIIVYAKAVLEEDPDEKTTGADYEIVMIQARTHEGDEPMAPSILMHNHFASDGGTDTQMSAEEFEAKLRESFTYWKTRATLAG